MKNTWVLGLLLVGCGTNPDMTATVEPSETTAPRPPAAGELLISQLYTTGATPAGGTDHYFSDQFVELTNTTGRVLDLSGVMVADVYGAAGEINPGMAPDSFRESRSKKVVMSTVWRIPAGTLLPSGASMVIAHDGTNHRPFSTIDLSSAGFEAYAAASGGDDDHPMVPNLESVVYNGGWDWLMTVFGPSVVVLAADTTLAETNGPYGKLPTAPIEGVLDGVDTLMDAESGPFKRLVDDIDSGFAYTDGPYTGVALHRKRDADGRLMDTNNSTNDFEPGAPDPWRPPITEQEVVGDPTVELGTGTDAFVPVADNDSLPLITGPQGGWHVDVAVTLSGFGPAGVELVYEALDTEANTVSYLTSAQLLQTNVLPVSDGVVARVGDRIVLDIDAVEEVMGETLILRVTAALGNQTWSDERQVVIVDEL